MLELSATAYAWVKALHVISVIAWMAGLLYLPRLFVYHAGAEPGTDQAETFKVMERRLLRAIMNPAMIAAYVFGTIMLVDQSPAIWATGWIWVKLAAIVVMTIMHHVFALWRKAFAEDRNERPARHFRIANEIPTLMMIIIVIFVIVKPF